MHSYPVTPGIIKEYITYDGQNKEEHIEDRNCGDGGDTEFFAAFQKMCNYHGKEQHIKHHRASQRGSVRYNIFLPEGNAVGAECEISACKKDCKTKQPENTVVFDMNQGREQSRSQKHKGND